MVLTHNMTGSPPRTNAILLIDDHAIFAKIFSAYLLRTQFHNFFIDNATSLDTATQKLKNQAFDLIVLDNRIPPHYNYTHSVNLLKNQGWFGPILLISGDEIKLSENNSNDQLISFFLQKDNLNERTLDQVIEKCLSNT